MKIFIGFENISSTVTDIQKSFTGLGHECYTALSNTPSVVELDTADFILQREFERIPYFRPKFISVRLRSWWDKRIRRNFFESCLKRFDAFIFIWTSFYPDFSDLEVLKKHGKKIIFVYAGDDVRWRAAASQEFTMHGLHPIPTDEPKLYEKKHLEKNLKRLRLGEKYADIIFSRLDQAQLQLRPYHRWNMMAEPANYKHNAVQRRENPVILHAPTAKGIKGTAFVLDVFNRLQREGIQFTPRLVENTPHLEMLEMIADADIVIDQLILPGTGKLSSEALSMGKVVVSLMGYDTYPQNNPADCPIVDANPDSLYTVLKNLIGDHNRRSALASKGRPYCERHLRPLYFCQTVLSLLSDPGSKKPDYTPSFFRNDFIPEKEFLDVYNDWLTTVKDCTWYKELVIPGERAGLKF